MATMNVSLPDPMREWVDQQIQTGHYSSASDYVRDLIRRDQEYLDKREILVQALIDGEKSGNSSLSIEEIWTSVKAGHCTDKYENNELIDEVVSLPVEERALVIDSLLRSLNLPEPEIDSKWGVVAQRRISEMRLGIVEAVPGIDVFEKIRKRFDK